MEQKEFVEKLLQLNVNDFTEEKNGLTYLSWCNGWKEMLKIDPSATFEVRMFEGKDGLLPYCGTPEMGYMVFTQVTANGITRGCHLPVMNNENKTMKAEPYTYKTRSGERTVEAATMFDVNKAIMRCLAKNLGMFGLGLYIYAGEDLPEEIVEYASKEQIETMKELNVNFDNVLRKFGVTAVEQLTKQQAEYVIRKKQGG